MNYIHNYFLLMKSYKCYTAKEEVGVAGGFKIITQIVHPVYFAYTSNKPPFVHFCLFLIIELYIHSLINNLHFPVLHVELTFTKLSIFSG